MKNYHIPRIEYFLTDCISPITENVQSQKEIVSLFMDYKKHTLDTFGENLYKNLESIDGGEGEVFRVTRHVLDSAFSQIRETFTTDLINNSNNYSDTFLRFMKKPIKIVLDFRHKYRANGYHDPSNNSITLVYNYRNEDMYLDFIWRLDESKLKDAYKAIKRGDRREAQKFLEMLKARMEGVLFSTKFSNTFVHEIQHAYDYFRGGKSYDEFVKRNRADSAKDREAYFRAPHEVNAYYTQFVRQTNEKLGTQSVKWSEYKDTFIELAHTWQYYDDDTKKRLLSRLSQEWMEREKDIKELNRMKRKSGI